MSHGVVSLLFNEIKELTQQDWSYEHKVDVLHQLFTFIYLDTTKRERLYFSTLFARIAFAGDKWSIQKKILFLIHKFRREYQFQKNLADAKFHDLYELGLFAVIKSIEILYKIDLPIEFKSLVPEINAFEESDHYDLKTYYDQLRIIALKLDKDQGLLIGIPESPPHEKIQILINIPGRNELFQENIEALILIDGFPISMNLLQVEVDTGNIYRPASLVLEPDFLIDVTSIAESFKHYGTDPMGYVLKKFMPRESTIPLLTGNVANFFLDELITKENLKFNQVFARVFDLYPLEFAQMSDTELVEFMQKCKRHFFNLKHSLKVIFPSLDIQTVDSVLEPSFYSEKYGIQGRLDLFEYKPNKSRVNIVELKSGKTFMPNAYKINHNHYIQTLLYDLLIQSVFQKVNTANYILYSFYTEDTVRHAPIIKSQQKEALFIRNKLLWFEKKMISQSIRDGHKMFRSIRLDNFPKASGFTAQNIQDFERTYANLDGLEKALWLYYSRFIATEHHLAKIGQEGSERINGLASLWLNELADKEEKFEIFSHLRIQKIVTQEDQAPCLWLAKTERTNKLANYRIGDIVVLYPQTGDAKAVLHHQIYKCIILVIEEHMVKVQLRNKQINIELFRKHGLWNLEKDILDSSFLGLYRGLYGFAQAAERKRKLIMGRVAPASPSNQLLDLSKEVGLTEEQHLILKKALLANDYFLMWGPPGTGKTSIMLRSLVRYLVDFTHQKIILLAYTNRAVDEICEAIESIRPDIPNSYFRIGSRYSTAPRFKPRLLQSKMEKINTRKDLSEFLNRQRVVVGTISSLQGKMELLSLLKFDLAIIDEASQILDPQLMGILPLFKKFILIGDHKQLPAVVVQNESKAIIDNPGLNEIGYYNMADSLFERLYKRCSESQWNWAFDILSYQGRMHEDLMRFPSTQFYEGLLQVMPGVPALKVPLRLETSSQHQPLDEILSSHRLIYIPTPTDNQNHTKTNHYEGGWVLKIIHALEQLYNFNNKSITNDTIGVITPYRAQIALIKNMLFDHSKDPNYYTIDTVERFQGGARDIIIFSLCTNFLRQLQTMISKSGEGVDRKLNVAITRAREQIILLGNEEILNQDVAYKRLIGNAYKVDLDLAYAEASNETEME